MIARVVVGTTEAKAFVPFELKHIVKTFPGRRWNSQLKFWSVPVTFVNDLADALRASGCLVYVTREDGQPWTSGQATHGVRSTPADGWADRLFSRVGPDRADAVFKALSRTLHPDAGGDTAMMQELNAARERAAFSRRSAS